MALSSLVGSVRERVQEIGAAGGFSLDPELIRAIFQFAKPLGHHESAENLNLGFGYLYYAMVRALRPKHVLVIGSGFGFSVVCLALALKDNAKGRLSFVDPSYSILTDGPFKTVGGTAQWDDPTKVTQHFARFAVGQLITHYRLRSDEFFARYDVEALPKIEVAFIDGSHAYDDVRQDFLSTLKHAYKNSYILLHDTNIYIREMVRHAGVKRWLRVIQRHPDLFEIVEFPFASGMAIVRVLEDDAWKQLTSALQP